MDPNANPPEDQNLPNEDKKFFVSEKEVNEFWNRERGKIRKQEEDKLKDKLTDLQNQLREKGDTSMTEEQLVKTVRSLFTEMIEPKLNQFGETINSQQEQQKKLEQKVIEDAKQRRIDRLQDIIAVERGRYQEDELIEDLIPQNLTGSETPEQIRESFKKAHEAYVKATSKFKKEETPAAGQQQQAQAPAAGTQQQPQQQAQTTTQSASSNGSTQAPAGTVAAPGLNNSATTETAPSLDAQSEEERLLEEMNEITDSKEWREKRSKFEKLFGKI